MDVSTIARRLQLMRQRMVAATLGAAATQLEVPPDLDTVLDQLSETLEFLYASEHRLKAQNQEIQAARLEIEQKYRYYRELFDSAPDGYVLTNTVLAIREVNQAAVQLLGQPRDRLLGVTILHWIEPGIRTELSDAVHLLSLRADGEVTFKRETRLRLVHQPLRSVELSVTCVRDFEERLVGFRWAFHDITQRKSFEEALRHEKEFAESLIRTAQAVVLVLSPQGRILRSNPFLVELCGRTAEGLEGRDWLSLVPVNDRSRLQHMVALAALNMPNKTCTAPLQTADDRQRQLRWSARSLPADGGAILVVGHDVTDLDEAQRRAVQSERLAAIGQMVTGLAHESRNALQRGQACVEMLALDVQNNPRALDLLARLQEAQAHLTKLYEEVRQFAAPVRLERRRCDLATLWRQAWEFVSVERQGRAATLREQAEGIDLTCWVDPVKLRQVFRNIFENALAAVEGPLETQVNCSATDLNGRHAIAVRIRDNGPGLSPEQRRMIFEPFFTTKTRGTGLGMTIVRSIVEAHEGRISVGDSAVPGTEIVIILPREEP
jgi:PAS domain S-box-containing protein